MLRSWWDSDLSEPELTDKRLILGKAALKTFKALTDAGKEVLFVFDAPTLASDFRYWDRTKVNQCVNALSALSDESLGIRGKLIRLKHYESLEKVCTIEERESGTYEAHAMIKDVIKH